MTAPAPMTGTCPDCGRPGLKLRTTSKATELFPNHKPPADSSTWPNPRAAKGNGWCKGAGRWAGESDRRGCW